MQRSEQYRNLYRFQNPMLTAALAALAPHLNGNSITSLSKSRITALARKTGIGKSDLITLVAAHKLATDVNLPADVLFGLAKSNGLMDWAKLAAADTRESRKVEFSRHNSPEEMVRFNMNTSIKRLSSGSLPNGLALQR